MWHFLNFLRRCGCVVFFFYEVVCVRGMSTGLFVGKLVVMVVYI